MNKNLERAKKNLRSRKGFSLVELIIVIAIMAALVAILAPQYMKYVDNSRKTADQNTADEIFTACKVAATNESLTEGFTATWNGANLTISTTAAADLIAANLGTTHTDKVITLPKKWTGTVTAGTNDYKVTYTLGTSVSVDAASNGWW